MATPCQCRSMMRAVSPMLYCAEYNHREMSGASTVGLFAVTGPAIYAFLCPILLSVPFHNRSTFPLCLIASSSFSMNMKGIAKPMALRICYQLQPCEIAKEIREPSIQD